ncbi:ABC transporter substrate-binding protein [Paenibacillus eucommiae]|uniref:ABC-type glycerol-3-phosphate transport system substrate-binding protein n=1 Tax=Paenibacillus eucommiae TaxID=1355755 RepID=A0ABS4IUD4_9BACL|nr:extracellular solute-binding protein [Paenibacillus eucommiae]MBP1990700.1 ABC-type glycerol-3-phosphate transport system substrate-binding protein [Paenibacillus eucommiae]
MKKYGLIKIVTTLTVCLLLVFMMSCSSKGGEPNSTEPVKQPEPTSTSTVVKPEDHEPITLKVGWVIPPENQDWPKMFEAFTKKFPWITVEGVYAENGEDELIKSIASGQPLDIIWNTSLDRAIEEGLIEDLTPYAEKDEEFKSYPYRAGYLDNFKRDGKLYSLSRGNDGFFILYNKDLLKQYGLEKPKLDWTWEQFKTMAKAATNPAASHYGLANSVWWHDFVSMILPMANGHAPNVGAMNEDFTKNLADGSVPEVLDDLNFFTDIMIKDGALLNAKRAADAKIALNSFHDGKSLFFTAIGPVLPGFKEAFPFDWDIAAMPKGTAQQVNFGWLSPMSISKASKHKEAAWELLKFWDATKEGQKVLFQFGGSFPNSDDPELVEAFTNAKVYEGFDKEVLQYTPGITRFDPSRFIPAGNELNKMFMEFGGIAYEEEISSHEYFPSRAQKLNEMIQQNLAK